MFKVYTLSHPVTNDIKYIGQTKRALKDRVRLHRNPTHKDFKENPDKAAWMKYLKLNGLRPKIELLEEFETQQEGMESEQYWTGQFKAWGFQLFNKYNGKNLSEYSKQLLRSIKTGKSLSKAALTASAEKRCRPIVQLSKDGTFIKEWPSIASAGNFYNIDRGYIGKSCKNANKNSGGFKWKYKEEYDNQ